MTTERKYNPDSEDDRRELASLLLSRLEGRGYKQRKTPAGVEVQYAKMCGPNIQVRVYTTIVQDRGGPIARALAKDAIRCSIVFKQTKGGGERGLASETRVFRVGKIDDIVARVLDRGYELQQRIPALDRCKQCSCPTFVSGKGNVVCADLCWTHK